MNYFRNNKTWIIAGFSILVALNLILLTVLFLGTRHMNQSMVRDMREVRDQFDSPNFIMKQMDLSDEQQREMKKIRQEFMEISDELEDEMHVLRKELSELLKTNLEDEAMLQKLSDSIGTVQGKLERSMFEHLRSVRALCNEEQLEKLDASMNRMHRKHHRRFRKHFKERRKHWRDMERRHNNDL